jgi:dihydroorotate dehydrogenase (NAD+) catalytic subunit
MAEQIASEPLIIGGKRGADLALRSPVLTAAGCFGDGTLFASAPWMHRLGGVVTHSITLRPRRHRAGRIVETVGGVLYALTLPNAGIDATLRRCAATWSGLPVPVVVSIAGETAAELARLAAELEGLVGVAAIELNLTAGALDEATNGEEPATVERTIDAVAAATPLPLLVKLSPSFDIIEAAQAAERGGADAVVFGHGWPAAAGGILSRHGVRLAGPAIAPLTLRLIEMIAGVVTVPVVACGGIANANGARAAFAAGANAVEVGAALLRDPMAAARIAAALEQSAAP